MIWFKDDDVKKIRERFDRTLKDPVTINIFLDSEQCNTCSDALALMEELTSMDNRMKINIFHTDDSEAKKYSITKGPVIILFSEHFKEGNVRYYGIPSGHEFLVLMDDLEAFSTGKVNLSQTVIDKIQSIKTPAEIRVYTTPHCQFCPAMVKSAHRFAMINSNITGSMVGAMDFSEEADEAGVMQVPHITLNGETMHVGSLPEETFATYIVDSL